MGVVHFPAGLSLVVMSPERDDPREIAALAGLFAAGLQRYHVRKPHSSRPALADWLRTLPAEWRPRLVLHQHHELVDEFGLGGRHWKDDGSAPPAFAGRGRQTPPDADSAACGDAALPRGAWTSRSCHDLDSLGGALGRYDSLLFGPVFPSISKPSRGALVDPQRERAAAMLAGRSALERSTAVFALGGVTAARLPRVRALGFDGAAVLGAVWRAADPIAAFCELQAVTLDPPATRFDL